MTISRAFCFFWRKFLHKIKNVQAENHQNKESLAAFASRLGVLAGRKRLKQTQIASQLSTPGHRVSPQRVGSWFQGRNFPGGDVEYPLAALLGVSRDWLIEGKETTETKDYPVNPPSLAEGGSPYGPEAEIEAEIHRRFMHLLDQARGNRDRLGWIREQMNEHLTPPQGWQKKRPLVLERTDLPSEHLTLSTETGKPIRPPGPAARAVS